ncbi:MAG: hypothetical protein ABIO94_06600 [Opitutaceae bacterium]
MKHRGCTGWFAVVALLFVPSGAAVAASGSTVGPTLVATPVVDPRIEILEIVGPQTFLGLGNAKQKERETEQRRIAAERAAQQQASREKIEEKARVQGRLPEPDPAVAFHRRLDQVERLLAQENFYGAVRAMDEAMKVKPKELPVSERVRALEARVKAQSALVDVHLKSDAETFVSIASLLSPRKFYSARVKLMPGDYEVKGQRRDRMDVIYMSFAEICAAA